MNDNIEVASGDIDNKIIMMDINNNWNNVNEQLIVAIAENAAGYKWLHEHSSKFYSFTNKMMGLSLIFFNSALSTETFLHTGENNSPVSVLRNTFTYISTVLSVVQTFFRFEEMSNNHMSASIEFSNLYHDIQMEMSKYRKNRNDADIFISKKLQKLDTLILNSPSISLYASLYFKYIFKNRQIELPDMSELIHKVNVVTEISQENIDKQNTFPQRASSMTKNDTDTHAKPEYNRTLLSNLNSFSKINGDITDADIKKHRQRMEYKMQYENDRYLKHITEEV